MKILQDKIAEKTRTTGEYRLREVSEIYLRSMQVAPSTRKRNTFAMHNIVDLLGDNLMDKLTANYIRTQFVASGKSAGTCNELIGRFRTFIRWAYKNDYISSTVCIDKLDSFKDTPHRQKIQDKFLNASELSAVLEKMHDDANRLVTEFLALSGLRIGELIALNDSDVTPEYIHVTKSYSVTTNELTGGKTPAACRDVHIQPELADCINRLRRCMTIRKYATKSDKPYFVVNHVGERFGYYAFNAYFRKYTESTIGRPLTVHALRHTHVSLLAENGYPLEAIARRLGHENSKITKQIYLHITEGIKKKDAEMIDKIEILSPFCHQKKENLPETSIS